MTDLEQRRQDNGEPSESDSDSSSDSDHQNERRGRTVIAEVRKAIEKGVKIPLDWSAAKFPCGQHRNTFTTYMGVVARERININYARWKDLPAELLDEVYTDIAKGFTVLPNRRRWILSRVCVLWRSFKSRLARFYMYKKSGKIRKKPPSKYPFLLQEDWDKFIVYCTSENFKEKSEKNSASSKSKTFQYRGGRLGYQHYHEEITKEFEERGIHVEKVPRHLIRLKAHKSKVDGSDAPGNLDIAEAIQTLNAQAQDGEIAAEGHDDISAKVLKKLEQGGRGRGVGSGITDKEYFMSSERRSDSQMQNEVKSLRSELAQLASKQNFMMDFLMKWSQQSTNQASPFTPDPKKQKKNQSNGINGEVRDLDGQSNGVRLFVETGPSGIDYQNQAVSKSLVSPEREARHHFEPDIGSVPEPETSNDSGPVSPINCDEGDCTPIDSDRAYLEHFDGTPPSYSGADIGKVRDLWISYVFQL